ncbi:MAG: hypothetical protein ACLPTZ_21165 [Beijerinckiaceae bacterium]|jgi:hypothetical protein
MADSDADKTAVPSRPTGETPASAEQRQARDNGHSLEVVFVQSAAGIITSFAWPVALLILTFFLIRHANDLGNAITNFMIGKQSFEVSATTRGIEFKVIQGLRQQAREEAKGAESVEKEFAKWGVDVSSAVCRLGPEALSRPEPLAKILWVDQHPGHNIGLEYAFGALGILVIDIDSNTQIDESFRTVGNFDVVITNMARPDNDDGPTGGLKTVDILRRFYPGTPVIIYSASYARQYEQDHPSSTTFDSPIVA